MLDGGRARKKQMNYSKPGTPTLSITIPSQTLWRIALTVDIFTSLADAYGCRIEINSNTTLAKPQYNKQPTSTIYSCVPGSSSTQYEIHVLSVYEGNRHTRPPIAGDTYVNVISGGRSSKPVILVLASYEPVNWILNLPTAITISRVIVVSRR